MKINSVVELQTMHLGCRRGGSLEVVLIDELIRSNFRSIELTLEYLILKSEE